jgi:hypothetical protein
MTAVDVGLPGGTGQEDAGIGTRPERANIATPDGFLVSGRRRLD